jgi:hypothetical protein
MLDDSEDDDTQDFSEMSLQNTNSDLPSQWLYDTGSSHHLTPDRASMMEYSDFLPHETYKYGTLSGKAVEAIRIGNVERA